MSRRALLIRNPASAGARDQAARIGRLVAQLGNAGVAVEVRLTEWPGHALELAEQFGSGFDLVIAAGGDGTVHEVASGIIASGSRVPLAIAPLGTGNDVAHLLGLRTEADVVQAITTARPTALDTIEVTWGSAGNQSRRHALLFAGTAFASELLRQTTPRVVRWFGPSLCYSVGFFRALASYRAPTLRVRTAAGAWNSPDGVLALAGNSPHAGGRVMRIGPGASLTDGILELTLIQAAGRLEIARQFIRLVRGTHVNHPKVAYSKGTWLEVEADPPQPLALDGEVIGTTPARFEVHPRSLKVFATACL